MGKGSKRADRIEDAAATVAGDMLEVAEALREIRDKAGWRLRKCEQDDLAAAIDRIDACRAQLTAELDSPNLNRRFLRIALSGAVLAGNIGVSVLTAEFAEAYDLQMPFRRADEAAAHAGEAAESVGQEATWVLAEAEGSWWEPLTDPDQGMSVRLTVSSDPKLNRRDARLSITFQGVPSALVSLEWQAPSSRGSIDRAHLYDSAIRFLSEKAPDQFRAQILSVTLDP